MTAAFYISGVIALLSTVMVITRLNAIHALLYLIVSLLAVAVVLYTLGSPFVAALEVIIYAGAIMVLFVFVVMLLNLGPASVAQESQWLKPGMWVVPGIFALILLVEMILVSAAAGGAGGRGLGPKEVGISLFTTYLLGVELASILLLAGLVGAFHIGHGLEKRG